MIGAMTDVRTFWQEVEAVFDPEAPAGEPGLYVARDHNPLARLLRDLRRPSGVRHKALISGAAGSGKTSELLHIAHELSSTHMVVMVDLYRVFVDAGEPRATDRLERWDLGRLLGLAIWRYGQDQLKHQWPRHLPTFANAYHWHRTLDVVVSQASGGLVRLSGDPAIGNVAVLMKNGWGDELLVTANDVNRVIAELEQAYSRRLVLILDGLDHLAVAKNARSHFDDTSPLRALTCDLLLTCPPELALEVRGLTTYVVPNIQVLDRKQPERPHPDGLAFFRKLVAQRMPALLERLPDQILARLAYDSGGIPRQFVQFVRGLAGEAWEAECEHADEALLEPLRREGQQRLATGLSADDIAVLESVVADPTHRRPSHLRTAELLARHQLVAYPDVAEWYYPHPLLFVGLLQHARSTAATTSDTPAPPRPISTAPQSTALHHLSVRDVGPIHALDIEFAPRVNLILGDNGLGKTFLLNVGWWVLTGSWPGNKAAWPSERERLLAPEIACRTATGEQASSRFDLRREVWPRGPHWPLMSGPVLYARVDGGVSLWDPLRNDLYGRGDPRSLPAQDFSASQLEQGVRDGDGTSRCNGLLEDWENWRHGDPSLFTTFFEVVTRLFEFDDEHASEAPTPGPATQLSKSDERMIPTLEFSYGRVPLTHLSAGMRRILGLAYALVWTWSGHRRAAASEGRAPAREVVLLIDELESHLHPRWQRLLLPALFEAMRLLDAEVRVQLIATSHSPLVLASLLSIYEADHDRIWHVEVSEGKIWIDDFEWANHGDVDHWLTSPFFGLGKAAALPAERATKAARAFLRGEPASDVSLATKDAIEAELRRTVPLSDPIWVRWLRAHGEGSA